MKTQILTALVSLVVTTQALAGAGVSTKPIQLSCQVTTETSSLKRVTILEERDADNKSITYVYSKNGKAVTVKSEYGDRGQYGYDYYTQRDNVITTEVAKDQNLFLFQKRPYFNVGAGDLYCEFKIDALEKQVEAFQNGTSIADLVKEYHTGFSLRGTYENKLINLYCDRGQYVKMATERNIYDYVSEVKGETIDVPFQCFDGNPSAGTKKYLQALEKYAATLN